MNNRPFDIEPARIATLGTRFTEFMNLLLELEFRKHKLPDSDLSTNLKDTIADGGVDAATYKVSDKTEMPVGNAAWQYKRSTFGPTKCAEEFEGAKFVHEIMKAGGSYAIAIGAEYTTQQIKDRHKAIFDKAKELKLLTEKEGDRIQVMGANEIARWGSTFPSLAVSRLVDGPGAVAVDFDTWANSPNLQGSWQADELRKGYITTLRQSLNLGGPLTELRVDGDNGIGKTRLVMEALRSDELSPFVVYVDAKWVNRELIEYLIRGKRTAILVIDECDAEQHVKMFESLTVGADIKLITIGPAGLTATRNPVISVQPMPDEGTEAMLTAIYPQLSTEARRFITDHSRGYPRWTMILADRVAKSGDAQAADLIAKNDIGQFITTVLPEGRSFFYSAVLALLERVGWDRELRPQLELLAEFAGTTPEELDGLARDLEQRGLLVRQGRYRSIAPHPLAVFLAAEAWKTEGQRIIEELLPKLDEDMALALFRRVAALGRFEPARSALPKLLAHDGPFATLEAIEQRNVGGLLTHLAIVLPDEVALHLGELIEAASPTELRQNVQSRRDLVWTLEKLVWHRRTFERAADALLKLALAENESWSNNATGTWTDLFGMMLPGTAATPTARLEYLQKVASSSDELQRSFAVEGAKKALSSHESIAVSGELQGGVLVEPRGKPATWGDVRSYREGIIELLLTLIDDENPEIARAAEDALIDAINPLLEHPFGGDALADALLTLKGDAMIRVRRNVEHLTALFSRHAAEDRNMSEKLEALTNRLPDLSSLEQLRVLAYSRRWDFDDNELQIRIEALLRLLPTSELQDMALLTEMSSVEIPAGWELGHGLAVVVGEDSKLVDTFINGFALNSSVLLGYLQGLVDAGHPDAYDQFLKKPEARRLTAKDQLAIAVRAPANTITRSDILYRLTQMSVQDGAIALFGWQRQISADEVAGILGGWLKRIENQDDYNRAVDWVTLWLHGEKNLPSQMTDLVLALVMLREKFPNLQQEGWDWNQLAKRFTTSHGFEIAHMIFDLIEADKLMIHESSEETQLLVECTKSDPAKMWADLAQRLNKKKSWRIEMEVRGWLLVVVPINIIQSWVGSDIERAQLVASIASVGGAEPSEAARFLLDEFGDNERVQSSLAGEFMSGFWMGNESDRIASQITQMKQWRENAKEPLGVRKWAAKMIDTLNEQLQRAMQQEAEEQR